MDFFIYFWGFLNAALAFFLQSNRGHLYWKSVFCFFCMCFQAADTGQRWSHVSHFDRRKKPPCVQFSSFAKETLTISYLILFLPQPWSVCAARRRVSSSAPRCKQRMRGKVGRAWLWRVPLCLAVTYWLLGLSVIWPARRRQQQQLCRPSPRLRRRSQRRPTCCEHLLGSLPLFPFLPPSLLSSLATSSPESVTAFSFIYIYTTPPHPPPHTPSSCSAGLLRVSAPPVALTQSWWRRNSSAEKLPQVLIYLTRADVSSVCFSQRAGETDTPRMNVVASKRCSQQEFRLVFLYLTVPEVSQLVLFFNI